MDIQIDIAVLTGLRNEVKLLKQAYAEIEIQYNELLKIEPTVPTIETKTTYLIASVEVLERQIATIKKEVHNAGFTLYYNGEHWVLILTKTATKFIGTLYEVLSMYIEEINTYKEVPVDKHFVKFRKPWTYTN
jgi:hypothetical protein